MAGVHVWRFGVKFLLEHAARVLTTNGRLKNGRFCDKRTPQVTPHILLEQGPVAVAAVRAGPDRWRAG
jgi:hypothetical protein